MKRGAAHLLGNQRGTALLTVLVAVVILGLTVAGTGASWKTLTQQSREEELFWRGDQIRRALESYYNFSTSGARNQLPAKLEDLVKDPRSLQIERHLRRVYLDPMTGEDWVLIKDPGGHITGVRSASTLEPFRKDGFPEGYDSFVSRSKYSEWEFVFVPKITKVPPPTRPGVPGSPAAPPARAI